MNRQEIKVLEPEQKVAEISKDFKVIEKKSEQFAVIKNPQDLQSASQFLVEVKTRINRIRDLQSEYVKPLKENIKKLDSLFKIPLQNYMQIEFTVKDLISAYYVEEDRKAREAEEKLKKDQAKKGGLAKFAPAPIMARPQATTRAEGGGMATAKKSWKFEIVNEEKLPRRYLKPNEAQIRADIAVGVKDIPGVRIFEDYNITARA